MNLHPKQFEIFCGTGGVGKTTLATSRALYLAKQGHKVLLITIDPSKRLKELLQIKDEEAGLVQNISIEVEEQKVKFDALLMSPRKTVLDMSEKSGKSELANNRIIKILSRPHGGMNEILSIVELKKHHDKNIYETIILDTPPGSHFVDFLKSCNKIKSFFDKKFIEIIKHLVQGNEATKPGLMKRIVSTGIKKLVDYLNAVTGAEFIDDFLTAINIIYNSKDEFLDAIKLQDEFRKKQSSNWFLVTSIEHSKYKEVLELKNNVKEYIHDDCYVCLNKSNLNLWENVEVSKESESIHLLKEISINKEKEIVKFVERFFSKTIKFGEVFEQSPLEHVKELTKSW